MDAEIGERGNDSLGDDGQTLVEIVKHPLQSAIFIYFWRAF